MFAPLRVATPFRLSAPPGLLVSAVAVALMFAATPFLIPELATRYGVTEGRSGLLSTAQVGAFALATWILPRLVAPSRTVFRSAIALAVAANLASAIAPSFVILIAVRVFAGLAAGALTWLVWQRAMSDSGSLRAVSTAGPITALIGSPLVAAVSGWGDRAVFVLLAVAMVPGVLMDPGIGDRGALRTAVSRSRSNRVLLAALFILTFAGASLFIFLAVVGREVAGLSAVQASLGFSLNAAGGLLGAQLAGRHRRPGWWLASAGPAAYLTVVGGSVGFFLGMFWWGFAFWMGLPGVLKMLADRSLQPGERAGDAQAFMGIGRAVAPIAGGFFADGGAYGTLAAVAAVGLTASGAAVIAVQEGRERLPATDLGTDTL